MKEGSGGNYGKLRNANIYEGWLGQNPIHSDGEGSLDAVNSCPQLKRRECLNVGILVASKSC